MRNEDVGRGNIRVETLLSSDTVADGEYVFDLNEFASRGNLLDYFYFVDMGGELTPATGGTVLVQLCPLARVDDVDLWQDIQDNSFNAADAALSTWPKPNGIGKAGQIKIILSGVTGVSGFRGRVTQSEI